MLEKLKRITQSKLFQGLFVLLLLVLVAFSTQQVETVQKTTEQYHTISCYKGLRDRVFYAYTNDPEIVVSANGVQWEAPTGWVFLKNLDYYTDQYGLKLPVGQADLITQTKNSKCETRVEHLNKKGLKL